jgi:ribonuclease VapC
VTIVDSSALIAVLGTESDAARYSQALGSIDPLYMSAGTLLEAGTVALHREGRELVADLFELIRLADIEIVPVSEQHARDAIDAYARFGRAARHPAQLDFGDCFAYALARAMDLPPLYRGADFAHTDIRSAL